MSFIRPEAAETLARWREAIIGGILILGGTYTMSFTHNVVKGFAFVVALVGAAIFVEGVRRARWPKKDGGLGVVEVDERRITYLSPVGGGALSINDLVRVRVRTTDLGPFASDFYWELTDNEGQRLSIPGDAENAGALFDALTVLPGANYEAVIAASSSTENAEFLVWESKA